MNNNLGGVFMDKKQVYINYLRVPNVENLIQVLSLPLSNKELQLELGDILLDDRYFGSEANRYELFRYLRQNLHRVTLFNLLDVNYAFFRLDEWGKQEWRGVRDELVAMLYRDVYETNQTKCLRYGLYILTSVDSAYKDTVYKRGLLPHHIEYFKDTLFSVDDKILIWEIRYNVKRNLQGVLVNKDGYKPTCKLNGDITRIFETLQTRGNPFE